MANRKSHTDCRLVAAAMTLISCDDPDRLSLFLPPTNEEVHVFARVCLFLCLSVCLLARLLKNACMDLDEMLRVHRRGRTD